MSLDYELDHIVDKWLCAVSVPTKTHFLIFNRCLNLNDWLKLWEHFFNFVLSDDAHITDFREDIDLHLFQTFGHTLVFSYILACQSHEFSCSCFQMDKLFSKLCHLSCLATISRYFADKLGKVLKMHLCPYGFFCILMNISHACIYSFYQLLMSYQDLYANF